MRAGEGGSRGASQVSSAEKGRRDAVVPGEATWGGFPTPSQESGRLPRSGVWAESVEGYGGRGAQLRGS